MSQCVGDPQRVMLALSVTMEWQQSCSGPLTLKAVWHSIRAWLVASKICIQTRLCAICLPMEEGWKPLHDPNTETQTIHFKRTI